MLESPYLRTHLSNPCGIPITIVQKLSLTFPVVIVQVHPPELRLQRETSAARGSNTSSISGDPVFLLEEVLQATR